MKTRASKSKKKKKNPPLPLPSSSSTPSEFAFAIARTAVSQICQSVGYRKTHLSTLETLTQIVTNYLRAIAAYASAAAASSNRTQSNLFDIVDALHDLHSVQGFAGASDLHRIDYCLLRSSVLLELANFVRSSVETPFARPIPRLESSNQQERTDSSSSDSVSLRAPPPHVPRWLPELPDRSNCEGDGLAEKKRRRNGEELWENSLGEIENGSGGVVENGAVMKKKAELGTKRGKVRFRIGGFEDEKGKEKARVGLGVNFGSGVCRGGKRVCLDGGKARDGFKK